MRKTTQVPSYRQDLFSPTDHVFCGAFSHASKSWRRALKCASANTNHMNIYYCKILYKDFSKKKVAPEPRGWSEPTRFGLLTQRGWWSTATSFKRFLVVASRYSYPMWVPIRESEASSCKELRVRSRPKSGE